MTYRTPGESLAASLLILVLITPLILVLITPAHAYQRGGPAAPPAISRSSAPVDLTGFSTHFNAPRVPYFEFTIR